MLSEVAASALRGGIDYGSERITSRVRTFRAGLTVRTANGADALSAQAILDAGGSLVEVVPAAE